MESAKRARREGSREVTPVLRPEAFQLLFESVSGLYLVLRPDAPRFTIVAASDAYIRATTTRREELLGRGLFEVFPEAANPATGGSPLRASLERVIEARVSDVMALYEHDAASLAGGDGNSERWSRPVNSPLLGRDGRLAYIVHHVEDVTELVRHERASHAVAVRTEELRDREALMQAVVETAVDAIITIDPRGTIESVNPAAERMLGYEAFEMIGRNVNLLMPSPQREEHDGYLASYLASGEKRIIGVGREVTARRKDGSVFPVHLSVSEVWLGERRLFTGFLRDLTEKKRLEAEYQQAQKMEAIGRLAGGVAHDFNNLLAGILGGLRIAAKGLDPGHPALPMLRSVEEEAVKGAEITRHLLDFSRTEIPAPRPVDPRATVRGAERMIRRLLGEDIEVRVELGDATTRVLADPGMLEQCLLNLAVNARDAMPDGGRLLVTCLDVEHRSPEAGAPDAGAARHVVLSVEDTGTGMDEATLRRAAEPFFTTKGPGRGTGLGLASVQSAVRGWGGRLELESAPGAGTTVRITFPRTEDEPRGHAAHAREPAPASHGDGETVLVVEDEKLVRLGVQHLLQELGYVVLTAARPDEALELLRGRGGEVDLLVTDVVLPGMGGPELVVAAKEILPHLPFLYMSAFPHDELVARGRIEPGAVTLEKPFTELELGAKVRAVLSSRPG